MGHDKSKKVRKEAIATHAIRVENYSVDELEKLAVKQIKDDTGIDSNVEMAFNNLDTTGYFDMSIQIDEAMNCEMSTMMDRYTTDYLLRQIFPDIESPGFAPELIASHLSEGIEDDTIVPIRRRLHE